MNPLTEQEKIKFKTQKTCHICERPFNALPPMLENKFLITKIASHYYTAWLKNMDSISYVYISWNVHGMWMIYITFERGGPKFSNTTARALV